MWEYTLKNQARWMACTLHIQCHKTAIKGPRFSTNWFYHQNNGFFCWFFIIYSVDYGLAWWYMTVELCLLSASYQRGLGTHLAYGRPSDWWPFWILLDAPSNMIKYRWVLGYPIFARTDVTYIYIYCIYYHTRMWVRFECFRQIEITPWQIAVVRSWDFI